MTNLADLLPAGGGQNNTDFVADGNISAGAPVILTAAGKAAPISLTASGNSAATASQYDAAVLFYYGSMVYDPDTQRVVLAYIDTNNSYYASIVVGEASASGVTWGTPVTVYSGQTVNFIAACYDTTNDRVGVAYNRFGGGAWYAGYSINGGTNTPTSIATHVQFSTGNEYYIDLAYHPGENVIVSVSTTLAYSPNRGKVSVARLGASSITLGNEVFFDTYGASVYPQAQSPFNLIYESNLGELVVNFADASNSSYMTTCVVSPSGTGSPTFGAYNVYVSEASADNTLTFDENSGKLLYTYRRASTSPTQRGAAKVGLASGTSVTVDATENYFTSTGQAREQTAAYDATAKKIGLIYYIYSSGSETRFVDATTSASDYSVTFGTDVAAYTAPTSGSGVSRMVAYDAALGKLVWAFNNDSTGISQSTILTVAATTSNLTSTNLLGLAPEAISDTATGTINTWGSRCESASLVLPASLTFGSSSVFEPATAVDICAAFDSSNNVVVFAYKDSGNSPGQGTAVVATVSGTSLTYGTPVVFETDETREPSIAFDSNENKVVIAYREDTGGGSNLGKAVVGTVSGTSISFGTAVQFSTTNASDTATTFDSNSNKVVIGYKDTSNSNYGTAVVGTVSGTSISFGTPVVFETAASATYGGASFDSTSNQVVFCYAEGANEKSILGAVSGTSISFGSATTIHSNGTSFRSVSFDSTNNRVVATYSDASTGKGMSAIGTVSGTSISYGTPVVAESASTGYVGSAFDVSNGRMLIVVNASSSGIGITGTVSGTTITFDSSSVTFLSGDSNYVGAVYDSNATKVVVSYGDASNSNYGTGIVASYGTQPLTVATDYYVQEDGTLSTTSTSPAQLIGKTITTTQINIKDYTG